MSGSHRLYERLHGPDGDAESAAAELASSGKRVVVVSACLLGERTRYDGGDKYRPDVVDPLLEDPDTVVMPLCPEILGGMGCPRRPVTYAAGDGDALARGAGARVVDDLGADRTAELDRGARRADELAARAGARLAVLKEKSPSCGAHLVHGPAGVQAGRGAFAARLAVRGLTVCAEEDVVKKG